MYANLARLVNIVLLMPYLLTRIPSLITLLLHLRKSILSVHYVSNTWGTARRGRGRDVPRYTLTN